MLERSKAAEDARLVVSIVIAILDKMTLGILIQSNGREREKCGANGNNSKHDDKQEGATAIATGMVSLFHCYKIVSI